VSDWGRSEAVESVLDRTLYDFLYRHWLRVEVEGIAGVPAEGPALILAAGGTPLDAAMIAAAIRRAHPAPRPVHFATARRLGAVPGLDMLAVKAGAVAAHPANLHRLLFDEGQLVLAFPEAGRRALHHRYRLARFAGEPVQAALRARAPIVPVAALGGEEALPVLARLGRLPLASGLPLPAKLRLRFLEPVDPVAHGLSASAGQAERLAERLRGLIQENLLEMLGQRRSVWLG
jgi:1-acyl-sn-glycerol-3-phosphate acyltransferase